MITQAIKIGENLESLDVDHNGKTPIESSNAYPGRVQFRDNPCFDVTIRYPVNLIVFFLSLVRYNFLTARDLKVFQGYMRRLFMSQGQEGID